MDKLTDWTLLRSFLAVIRQGSLSAAARITGLTQPTIGRHVDELERALNIALFTRSPSGLIPTEVALGLVSHAETMEASLAALIRTASAGEDRSAPRGTVRITASEIVGTCVLPSILAEIRARYPDIILELVLNNRTDDLLLRNADIAVRMVRPEQTGLVARKIGDIPLVLHAHRRYIARYGQPDTLEALTRFHLIGFDRDDHSARSVVGGRLPIAREIFAFRCDSDFGQLCALRAGLGIGLIQHAIARQDPDLVPVLADQFQVDLACWLTIHEDQRKLAPIRTVLDIMAEGLTQWLSA
jgi:DNA-binding transcriptional LysR family regulator